VVKSSQPFMELENSLLCSEKPASEPYIDPDKLFSVGEKLQYLDSKEFSSFKLYYI
jgi:hypothetical protein